MVLVASLTASCGAEERPLLLPTHDVVAVSRAQAAGHRPDASGPGHRRRPTRRSDRDARQCPRRRDAAAAKAMTAVTGGKTWETAPPEISPSPKSSPSTWRDDVPRCHGRI